ncbi:reverse transcriptase domain-containing protein [Tanacetum coccineum]
MHAEHHEKQTESILNYLEEPSFHCFEKMKERFVYDWIIMPSSGKHKARQLMAKYKLPKSEPEKHYSKECAYQGRYTLPIFLLNGTDEAVSLIRWFKWIESIFSRSKCAEKNKVRFAVSTLTKEALFWWNSFTQSIGNKCNLLDHYTDEDDVWYFDNGASNHMTGVTPYEKFYGEKSNLEDLKVFGCVAYERIVSKHLKKIDDRLKPLIYLRKEPSPRSFRLYNLRENKIIISAYVVFDEKKVHNAIVHAKVNNVHCLITVHETPFHVTSPKGDEDEYENDVTPISVRCSTRNKVLPTRLVDYQLNVHELMFTLDEEPRNYNEAKLNPKWLKAMKTKLESIIKNNTWKLVPLLTNWVE